MSPSRRQRAGFAISPPSGRLALSEWEVLAQKRMEDILKVVGKADLFSLFSRKQKIKLPGAFRVEVSLVGAKKMADLNSQYRKKKGPTDVLSFGTEGIFAQQGYLGDLVICLPVVKKQAKHFGHSVQKELDVLLVHGILHLLGFDHELGEVAARQMSQQEERLLSALAKAKRLGKEVRSLKASDSGRITHQDKNKTSSRGKAARRSLASTELELGLIQRAGSVTRTKRSS